MNEELLQHIDAFFDRLIHIQCGIKNRLDAIEKHLANPPQHLPPFHFDVDPYRNRRQTGCSEDKTST